MKSLGMFALSSLLMLVALPLVWLVVAGFGVWVAWWLSSTLVQEVWRG